MSESTSTASPTKYMVFKGVSVSDVKHMFKRRMGTNPAEFFCKADEEPATFSLQFQFGNQMAPDEVDIEICVHIKGVRIHREQIEAYDEEASLCASARRDEAHDRAKDENYCLSKLKINTRKLTPKSNLYFSYSMVYSKLPESKISESPLRPPDLTLKKDLQQLFDAGQNTDVLFSVQGETVKAHKILLTARCPYFDRMFQSGMNESLSNEVHITDVSPTVFKELIQFLYSGTVPEFSSETTIELLSAADKYGIRELRDQCESILCANLYAENVVDVLILAEELHCHGLKSEAASTFRSTVHILRGDGDDEPKWQQLTKYPDLLLELLEYSFD